MNELRMSYSILKPIAILNEGSNGWTKELNLISWNGGNAKFDIRWWPPNKQSIGKGMTFTPEEIFTLGAILHTLPRDLHKEYGRENLLHG
ncbi:YdbC family protein [Bacillus badius]|uniref:YdbC family protein n=1 Tax=Bacillus badius TaxID=1455 RepID=UPI000ACBA6C6|nr:PC4/YdbC family ssDNA-binding protein [Bacillus badius]MED4717838.1 PC4/YdbC family ssDNA-binding protein [Bacillus badius]